MKTYKHFLLLLTSVIFLGSCDGDEVGIVIPKKQYIKINKATIVTQPLGGLVKLDTKSIITLETKNNSGFYAGLVTSSPNKDISDTWELGAKSVSFKVPFNKFDKGVRYKNIVYIFKDSEGEEKKIIQPEFEINKVGKKIKEELSVTF